MISFNAAQAIVQATPLGEVKRAEVTTEKLISSGIAKTDNVDLKKLPGKSSPTARNVDDVRASVKEALAFLGTSEGKILEAIEHLN